MNNIIKNKVIVVGGNHHNTLWVIRSLGIAGIYPYVIINNDSENSFVIKSKYIEKSWIAPSEKKMLSLLKNNFYSEENKPVIISTSDKSADVLDQNYSWLSQRFILPNIDNKQCQISYWMGKGLMSKIAEKSGFNIPKTWHLSLSEVGENYIIPEDIVYPCILKPEKSSDGSKHNFCICKNRQNLITDLDFLKTQLTEILIQEYLKPDFEIAILGAILPNTKRNILPGLLYKLGTCTSIHSLGMATYACLKSNMKPYIDKSVVDDFFTTINYSGIYSIECFVNNNKPYFLEVNLRTDGNLFFYTQAGVNLPLLWVLDVTGNDISSFQQEIYKDTYGIIEISYLKHLRNTNLIHAIKNWYKADCFSIFSRKDIKPFIYKFFYSLK